MNANPESILPPALERRFAPADLDAEDLGQLETLFEALAAMAVDEPGELEEFLAAWLELDAIIDETSCRLQVQKARVTNDEERSRRWAHFVEAVMPSLKEWDDRLGRKLLNSPTLEELDSARLAPALRVIKNEADLFRQENIALQTEIDKLETRYGELSGDWTVEFDGEVYPHAAMMRFMMDSDRDVRQRAWEACAERRHRDRQALDEIFQQLFELRHQVAQNAGFDNFRDYIFAEKLRDYDADACFAFHQLVEEEVLPLVEELENRNREKLGVETLRPWDTSADPDGAAPLKPFENAEELVAGVGRMMNRIDGELGAQFEAIIPHFDLEARAHKAQGGFMMFMQESRRPFIFANASGIHHDVIVLLHEAGHAFHFMRCSEEFPLNKSHIPIEFAEVGSMAMELFHYGTLDEFYGEEDRRRAVKEHLRRVLSLLVMTAAGDAFQHELYTRPDQGIEDRGALWVKLKERFNPYVDYSGIDKGWLESEWHKILHFFIVPFYFIEYGFAQLGALQLAMNAEKDLPGTMEKYKSALALGPSASTAELFEAAGAQFVPTRETVGEMMGWIRDQLFDD